MKTQTLKDLSHLGQFYATVLPSPETLQQELDLWNAHVVRKKCLAETAIEAMQLCQPNFFPNINRLLQILGTLPVSVAEGERSFSACKLLKNYLRNRCAQERLSALALMYIHKDMDIDVNDVIDMFARKHKRNLNFMS